MLVAKIEKLPVIILALILIFLPLISLPWTPDQIDLNKQMFLYAAVPLLGISLIVLSFLQPKAIKISLLDGFVALFCLSFLISGVFASGNKWEGVATESLPMLTLLALYVLIRQINNQDISLITIVFVVSTFAYSLIVLWQNFINANIPPSMVNQTVKAVWYPGGSLFSTIWLIIIAVPLSLGSIIYVFRSSPKFSVYIKVLSIVILFFLLLAVFSLARPLFSLNSAPLSPLTFLDHQTGWKILLQGLYSSPIIGVGPGNFIDAFTNFKPPEFNTSPLWNMRFTNSSNFVFYLTSTTGVIGLLSYLSILTLFLQRSVTVLKNSASLEKSIVLSVFAAFILQFFFPASFLMLAIFLILLAILENIVNIKNQPLINPPKENLQPALTIPLTLLCLIFLFYLATTYYQAEIYAQKAAVAIKTGNGETALTQLSKATKLAPYRETYFVVSSQVNLAIAGNIVAKTATVGAQISQSDMQLLQEYIKTSITDAKKSTELSPRRTSNWENLANIYRRVSNIVQEAYPWIIASYDKAIGTDPNNPRLFIEAGGVFYGKEEYATASALFKKAVELKPDLNNAHYNLAHALFKLKDYENAVIELNKAIDLTNPSSPDYARAKGEIELFKAELQPKPTPPQPAPPQVIIPPENLVLTPTPAGTKQRKILIQEGLNIATGSSLPATPSSFPPYVTPSP